MKRFKKRFLRSAVLFLLAVTLLAGCQEVEDTDVVAEVGEDQITVAVANFFARYQQSQLETYYSSFMGDDMWSQEVEAGVTYEESVKETILTDLEDLYILEDHMADYGVELTEEENNKIAETATTFLENNTLNGKEVISADEETVTRVLELFTIQAKMWDAMVADVDRDVPDEEAAQKSMQYVVFSYTKTNEDGTSEDMTEEEKAQQQETAQAFADGLKESGTGDLEAAAAEAGYEVQTATFDSESVTPSEEVVAAADALTEEGEVSDLIVTDSGCYVVKLTSLLDREATDAKKEEIISERENEAYTALLEEWREAAEITEHEKVWDAVSFQRQGVTMKMEEDEEYASGSDTTGEESGTTDEETDASGGESDAAGEDEAE